MFLTFINLVSKKGSLWRAIKITYDTFKLRKTPPAIVNLEILSYVIIIFVEIFIEFELLVMLISFSSLKERI